MQQRDATAAGAPRSSASRAVRLHRPAVVGPARPGLHQLARFAQPPWVRGVYFTSGTQEGSPIDRVMGSLSRSFGIERAMLAPQKSSGPQLLPHGAAARGGVSPNNAWPAPTSSSNAAATHCASRAVAAMMLVTVGPARGLGLQHDAEPRLPQGGRGPRRSRAPDPCRAARAGAEPGRGRARAAEPARHLEARPRTARATSRWR